MKKFIFTAGLGFGDEGKGTIVDSLVHQHNIPLVVRYNGGSQCAHNVVTMDGRHHTFSQFGSGTFVPDTKTFLSRHVYINPSLMIKESDDLQELGVVNGDPLNLVYADQRALLTTPYHIFLNRLRETSRGSVHHGSCGMGIGETRLLNIQRPDLSVMVEDLASASHFERDLRMLQGWCIEEAEKMDFPGKNECDWYVSLFIEPHELPYLKRSLNWYKRIHPISGKETAELLSNGAVFEGAQGVMLDEMFGFEPHVTWSDTTFNNAYIVLDEAGLDSNDVERIGITRTYATRHGPGPFPTFNARMTRELPDSHNGTGKWQGSFRAGHLDIPMLRYAIEVLGGLDGLAVTHVDKLGPGGVNQVCTARGCAEDDYHYSREELLNKALMLNICSDEEVLPMISKLLGVPISITSTGPRWTDKEYCGLTTTNT